VANKCPQCSAVMDNSNKCIICDADPKDLIPTEDEQTDIIAQMQVDIHELCMRTERIEGIVKSVLKKVTKLVKAGEEAAEAVQLELMDEVNEEDV